MYKYAFIYLEILWMIFSRNICFDNKIFFFFFKCIGIISKLVGYHEDIYI